MARTVEQREADRDHDEQYLPELSDALGSLSSSLYDQMFAMGLRIVRDDRDDPPQQALIERIEDLAHKYEQPDTADYAGKVHAYRVANDLRTLLD